LNVRRFWDQVGDTFPSLKGAPSTAYYRRGEQDLFRDFGVRLEGARLFKSDLWDEAKNTEILLWAAQRGARVFAVDISRPILCQAKTSMSGYGTGLGIGDIRFLPFLSSSMDLIYSMGTIEHFPEYRQALAEMYRILKPGGLAIIGVPNKMDPFLRPLLVSFLRLFHAYHYGREASFTPGQLRRMLEDAGFECKAVSGLLFMPGWLRMLDLLLHTRNSILSTLTKPFIAFFAFLHRRFPAVRRHGYLLAMLAEKPMGMETLVK